MLEHCVEALQRTFSLLKRINILWGKIQGTDHLPQPLAQGAEDLCPGRERLWPQVFPLTNQQRLHQRQPLIDPCHPPSRARARVYQATVCRSAP